MENSTTKSSSKALVMGTTAFSGTCLSLKLPDAAWSQLWNSGSTGGGHAVPEGGVGTGSVSGVTSSVDLEGGSDGVSSGLSSGCLEGQGLGSG